MIQTSAGKRRSGFTLIEIVVAFAILMLLVVLALGVITSMQGPTTEITLRADMTAKGNATSNLILQELNSGFFDTPNFIVASQYSSAIRDIDMTPAAGPSALGPPAVPGVNGYFLELDPAKGRAIRYYRIEGFNPPSNLILGETVILAFIPGPAGDGDRDGLFSEWRLVLVTPAGNLGANEVTIQHDICDGAQPGLPTGVTVESPYFELTFPSRLRIVYTLIKQTGYNTKSSTREYSVIRYDRTINLRNVTPSPP